MLSPQKLVIASAYTAVLLIVGLSDAALTQDLNLLPASETNGIATPAGPDVFEILNEENIVTESTREESLLQKIVPAGEKVERRVILLDNDRLAYFAWVDSTDAKTYFAALKEALSTSFSPDMQDLVDEVQERQGKPVRNVLSFLDPSIHEERLLFIRVRQRLYEFHVAPGKEPEIQEVMDALTE